MRFNRNIIKTALCYLILLISYSYPFAQDSDDVIIDYKIVDQFGPPLPSINYLTETANRSEKRRILLSKYITLWSKIWTRYHRPPPFYEYELRVV